MSSGETERILALVPNWLGDVAMCTPALRALRRQFPEARLTVAGRASACALLDGLPWIDRLLPIPNRPGLGAMLKLRGRLKPHARDLAVIFPHSFRNALLASIAGARRRVGYDRDGRALLLTDAVPPCREGGRIKPIYMAKEYLDLVSVLGCEDDGAGLELHADAGESKAVLECIQRARESGGGKGPLVGIAPGAAFGPSKRWPAERYAAVADRMAEAHGACCVLITGPEEEDTREAVRAAARTPLLECHGGHPTVARLKATVAQLDLLIGNDSGPRHVAIAFGKPVVCVMGSTSPRYTDSPWEQGRVLRVDVDCGPCQKPNCETDHRCMTGIAVEDVVEAALESFPGSYEQ